MTAGEKIEVIAYAGRKGDERPEAFFLDGERITVVAVEERWIEEDFSDRIRKRYFRIRGSDGKTHKLSFNEQRHEWNYESRHSAPK